MSRLEHNFGLVRGAVQAIDILRAAALIACAAFAIACRPHGDSRGDTSRVNIDSMMNDPSTFDEPGVVRIGDRGPGKGGGFSVSVGTQFGAQQMREVYRRLIALDSSGEFKQFACPGDTIPQFRFTLGLHQAGELQERLVDFGHTPELKPWGRSRCLYAGFGYVVARTFAQVDSGPGEDYGYTNPSTGKVIPPPLPGERHDRWWPTCRCELRDSVQEWVTNGSVETSLGANAH